MLVGAQELCLNINEIISKFHTILYFSSGPVIEPPSYGTNSIIEPIFLCRVSAPSSAGFLTRSMFWWQEYTKCYAVLNVQINISTIILFNSVN